MSEVVVEPVSQTVVFGTRLEKKLAPTVGELPLKVVLENLALGASSSEVRRALVGGIITIRM